MSETNESNVFYPEGCVVIDSENQQPQLKASIQELSKILQVIEEEILPKTKLGIEKGNKVFGAALISKDFEFMLAETNDELNNPLFHGEINLINAWTRKIDASQRGKQTQESICISTHEPCCMCIR